MRAGRERDNERTRHPSVAHRGRRRRDADAVPAPRRQRRRRVFVNATAIVCVAAIGAGVFAVVQPFDGNGDATSSDTKNAAGTSVATVTTQTFTARTSVNGTLEYAGAGHVVNHANGLVTWVPSVGDVVDQGGVLYRIAGAPVVLLYGANPAYRDLAYGAEGPDVEQLNRVLVTLGDAPEITLDPTSDQFTAKTRAAVKKLQAASAWTRPGRWHSAVSCSCRARCA